VCVCVCVCVSVCVCVCVCECVCVCVFWLLLVIAKFQLQAASKDCTIDAGLQVTKQISAAVNPPVQLKSNLAHNSSKADYSVWCLYYLLGHSRTVSWSGYNHLQPNLFQFIKHHLFYHQHYTVWPINSKAVPLQAWSGPEGSRKLRFPDFMTTTQDGGRLSAFTPRKCSWYSFLLEVELTSGPECDQKDYVNEKSTDTIWDRTSDLLICSTAPLPLC